MTNKIENQENLQNNLSVQELQEIIADDNISALDKKIPKITKLGESENFDNIYIDKRNSLTSQLEAHKAEIELGNIAKKYTKEEQIDKQDFKASNPFEFQGFATLDQISQIKQNTDVNRQIRSDKVENMVSDLLPDFVPDSIKKRFS